MGITPDFHPGKRTGKGHALQPLIQRMGRGCEKQKREKSGAHCRPPTAETAKMWLNEMVNGGRGRKFNHDQEILYQM
jgi:hypothetical protein